MSNTTQTAVIIIVLIVFATTAIIGGCAGYDVNGYKFSFSGSRTPSGDTVTVSSVSYPWYDLWDQAIAVLQGILTTAKDIINVVPGLGFLFGIMNLSVPGMPIAITAFYWILGLLLMIAGTEKISHLLTGGGN